MSNRWGLDTIVSTHREIFSFCCRWTVGVFQASRSQQWLTQSASARSSMFKGFLSRLNWRNNLPQVELDKTEKKRKKKKTFCCQLPSSPIHPPPPPYPSLRLLSSVRLLLPVETWSCLCSQFYFPHVPE